MISVANLIQGVRYKQHDNNEVLYSDYDIIQSLNEALRYINYSYSLKNADFLEKVQEYHKADMDAEIDAWNEANPDDPKEYTDFSKGLDLPDDFLSIVSIKRTPDGYPLHPCPAQKVPSHREFKVVAGKLYVRGDVDLLYRYSLEAKTADDTVELPGIFYDLLVKMAGLILTGAETDVMRQAVDELVGELVPARRYANRQIHPVWKV